jgi:hypothetical protein
MQISRDEPDVVSDRMKYQKYAGPDADIVHNADVHVLFRSVCCDGDCRHGNPAAQWW